MPSFSTNHFGRQSQLTIPSSFTATTPALTTSEPEYMSVLRMGDAPMPEYEEPYEELDGEDMPTENEEP